MSIVLENVCVRDGGTQQLLFDGLSLDIANGGRVGILGVDKSVNNALLRLICGTRVPDTGLVRRDIRVSWPIPFSAFLMGGFTLARNIRFITRLYGIDDEDLPRRIVDMMEMTEFLNVPLNKCPRYCRNRLAFGLGVGLDFDAYLFDGAFTPVDKPFKGRAAEIAAERTAGRGLLVATGAPAEVEQNCESVYVLQNGRAIYFPQTSEGVEHFKELLAAEKKKERATGGKVGRGDDEEELLSDVDILGAAVADAVD